MTTEIDIAFALLRAAIGGVDKDSPLTSHFSPLTSKDWWSLFRLLQQNHVAALTADTMATLDVPREVKIPWLAERDKAVRWHRYQLEVQQEIVSLMEQHGIKTLVLKGTHLSQYYPQPELREFGDLDLYFYDRHDEADRVAKEKLGVEVRNDSHHHSKYNYRGVTVESHYDFVNTHYPRSNRRYEALLKELVGAKKTLSTFNFQLSTFEILFLLRHMACHFAASRITLRDVVDWTLTCRALADKVDWQLVKKAIEDFGMTDFVAALNTIAENRLATQPPSHSVTQPLSHPVTQSPSHSATQSLMEHDIVYGSVDDSDADGPSRLGWKLRRWHALAWKRKMVYNDSALSLYLTALTSHSMKPQSIMHKQ